MGVFRTYFSKDNVLIKDKFVNTGLNPVTEIFYGTDYNSYSRYIFNFTVDEIKERIEDKRINGNVKHYLKMTNTLLYDKELLGKKMSDGREHASSFDLVLFKVPESWDEGTGYDYEYNNTVIDVNGSVYETSSNWFERNDVERWSEAGIYSGTTSLNYLPVKTIHFDLGNENIEVDITDIIQDLIENGLTNFHGLGLAFKTEYEQLKTDKLYSVGFFGKDTNTFFEPFIETVWEEGILDDRNDFQVDKLNKLYLYTNIKKEPTNLDVLPESVVIRNTNYEEVLTLTGITHEAKGVYSVTLEFPSEDFSDFILTNFTDTWTGLVMDGRTLSDVEMTFTLKENTYYNLGSEVFYEPGEYQFTFTGLKRGEKIAKGEVRKVIVTIKEMFGHDSILLDNLSYRVYIKQGADQIDIVKESKVNRAANQNYFYFDTSWLIPQEYCLELIMESNGTTIKKDDISFTIVDPYKGRV